MNLEKKESISGIGKQNLDGFKFWGLTTDDRTDNSVTKQDTEKVNKKNGSPRKCGKL